MSKTKTSRVKHGDNSAIVTEEFIDRIESLKPGDVVRFRFNGSDEDSRKRQEQQKQETIKRIEFNLPNDFRAGERNRAYINGLFWNYEDIDIVSQK